MKKRGLSLLLCLAMMISFEPVVAPTAFATDSKYYNFSSNYSYSSDPATYMINIAKAQNNKTKSDLGYSGAWCADFIGDVAILAGQSTAIPIDSAVSGLRTKVLNAGGTTVTSPQAGDLVFYYCTTDKKYCHVGLMTDSVNSIHGNVSGKVYQMKYTIYRDTYYDDDTKTGGTCYTSSFIRPNYSGTSTPLPTYTLKTGTYYIRNKATGKYLHVEGGGDANNTNVIVSAFTGVDAQKWEITQSTSTGNNTVAISPLCSSRLLNSYGDVVSSGKNVNLYHDTSDASQRWGLESVSGGYFVIRNAQNSSCVVDVNEETVNAFVNTYNGGDSQLWEFIDVKTYTLITGTYYLKNKATGKCLHVDGGGDTDGTNIIVSDLNLNDEQKWQITESDCTYNNTVKLSPVYSSRVLNCASSSPVRVGVNISLVHDVHNGTQRFGFEYAGGGYYYIRIAENDNLVVDVNEETANVFVNTYNGGDSQKWWFTDATKRPEKPTIKNCTRNSVDANTDEVTFYWDETENTTHYSLYIYTLNTSDEYEIYSNAFNGHYYYHYAESGVTKATLEAGNTYYIKLQATNKDEDYLYTDSDLFSVTVTAAAPTLSSISVKTLPSKTTYNVGETPVFTGLTLTAIYSDSSTQTVTSGFTCSDVSTATAGTKTVTVTYEGKTTTFEITVTDSIPEPDPVSETDPQIFVESARTTAGKTVNVDVLIKNNPGFSYLEITPDFASALTLKNVTNGTLISDFTKNKQYIWVSDEDVTEDGALLTLTFDVPETAEPGVYDIGFTVRSCVNYDEQNVALKVSGGAVTVLDIVYGDATGDLEIDGRDVIRLKKYLAAYDYDTDTSTVDINGGGDANGDGVIDGRDVIRLKKYLAAYDYETGTSTVTLGE